MRNVQTGQANYWLGCFGQAPNFSGIDTEGDCPAPDGDEQLHDGSDAGVEPMAGYFYVCGTNWLNLSTANCGAPRTVYLNVLVDWNSDGDWNDNVTCAGANSCPCPQPAACVQEWVVKNHALTLPAGCGVQPSPSFDLPDIPDGSLCWTRVTLTDDPVDDDFPWAGSANRPGGFYAGGETEDYPLMVLGPDPVRRSTWGRLKIDYR